MYINKENEPKYDTKYLTLDYKLLEWRLMLNRQLYEEKVIDLKTFSMVEKSVLARMTRIVNEIHKDDKNMKINTCS